MLATDNMAMGIRTNKKKKIRSGSASHHVPNRNRNTAKTGKALRPSISVSDIPAVIALSLALSSDADILAEAFDQSAALRIERLPVDEREIGKLLVIPGDFLQFGAELDSLVGRREEVRRGCHLRLHLVRECRIDVDIGE